MFASSGFHFRNRQPLIFAFVWKVVLPSNNQSSPLISGDRRTAYSLSCDSPVPVFIDLAIKKVFLIMAALMK
jgi:hypothetical protein